MKKALIAVICIATILITFMSVYVALGFTGTDIKVINSRETPDGNGIIETIVPAEQ